MNPENTLQGVSHSIQTLRGLATELHIFMGGDISTFASWHVLVPVLQGSGVEEVPISVRVLLQREA